MVHRSGPLLSAASVPMAAVALVLAVGLLLGAPVRPAGVAVRAASPTPAAGDTRTPGEGAGFVGQPILAALAVVVLGCAAAGATVLYLRLRRDD